MRQRICASCEYKPIRLFDLQLEKREITVEYIIETASKITGVPIDLIKGSSRKVKVVTARYIAVRLVKRYNRDMTLSEIGSHFNRDYSTIIYAISTADELIQTEKAYRKMYDEVNTALNKRN